MGFDPSDSTTTPDDAMTPEPAIVPLRPAPMIARRVQPRQAKLVTEMPTEASHPTTLETVAKVVNDVAKIADALGKLFHTVEAKPAQAAQPAMPFPADWGFGGMPALPTWDMGQMPGFDPNLLTPDFDPNAGW